MTSICFTTKQCGVPTQREMKDMTKMFVSTPITGKILEENLN
jgi:hypothetical protein